MIYMYHTVTLPDVLIWVYTILTLVVSLLVYIYIIVVLEYRSLVLKHVKHLMSSVSYNMDWICDIGTCF